MGGERWVEASVVIDASGDADVTALAGGRYDDARTRHVDVARAAAVPKAALWGLLAGLLRARDPLPAAAGAQHMQVV